MAITCIQCIHILRFSIEIIYHSLYNSLMTLKGNGEFSNASQEKTAANANVKKRIEKAKEIIVLQ